MEELDQAYFQIVDTIVPILRDMSDEELRDWWLSPTSDDRDRWEALEHFAEIGEHRLRERCRAIGFSPIQLTKDQHIH